MAKAVFSTKANPSYDDIPESRYHFPHTYLNKARETVGDWIIYYEPRRGVGQQVTGRYRGGRDGEGEDQMTKMVRAAALALTLLAAAAWAEELGGGVAGPRYMTPRDCPRFKSPGFISWPLEKAYPGIEYNIRPGVRDGRYP